MTVHDFKGKPSASKIPTQSADYTYTYFTITVLLQKLLLPVEREKK